MSGRLVVRRLHKAFGDVIALHGVDLEVSPGSVVALVGESAAGKSTLARCALALTRPDAGTVRWDDADPFALPAAERRRRRRVFQFVPQDAGLGLDPRQRVGAALIEARAVHRLPARGDLLELVGLAPSLATRFPHQLSGGQRHRALLARALATEPSTIVVDEPTAGLDTIARAQIVALLGRLVRARGLGALIITHDVPAAMELAQRIVVLEHGRVVEAGGREVLRRPAHPHTQALVAASR